MVDFDKINLDEDERELEDSFERGEWRSVENLDAEIKRYQSYAQSFSERSAKVEDRERSRAHSADPVTHQD